MEDQHLTYFPCCSEKALSVVQSIGEALFFQTGLSPWMLDIRNGLWVAYHRRVGRFIPVSRLLNEDMLGKIREVYCSRKEQIEADARRQPSSTT